MTSSSTAPAGTAGPFVREPGDWTAVRGCLARDRERLVEHFRKGGAAVPSILLLHPSYQCVLLYRLSAYHFARGRRLLARLLWHANLWLTGADFGPMSRIGPGVVVLHPISTQVFGQIGADCTLWGHGGIGGGRSGQDIGAGPGLPVVGDRVVFEARAMVLGPVQIGDGCVLGAGCIVLGNLDPGTIVEVPDRLMRTVRAP